MDDGLFPEYPMNIFLGCTSEIIFRKKIKNDKDKKEAINKLIKYIKLGGFIQVSKPGHALSLQGFIEIKENNKIIYYFSIVNPHKGNYF